ncbi:MAG: hypothetical protein L0J03_17180, partial [Brevibacterium sp.]|nr:hypothetical protein [Brevibacterium sp.]
YSNHLSSILMLLKTDVALIRIDQLLEDELAHNSTLLKAMAAKTRTGYATRALLGDETLKEKVRDLVFTAAKTQKAPVVLHLSSPKALLATADRAANPDSDANFDDDAAEFAAVYYADWIRTFAEHGIAGIIFDERAVLTTDKAYQPIRNTAEHYGWLIGHRGDDKLEFGHGTQTIPVIGAEFWDGSGTAPSAPIQFSQVPTDAVPEQVLARIKNLKEQRQTS